MFISPRFLVLFFSTPLLARFQEQHSYNNWHGIPDSRRNNDQPSERRSILSPTKIRGVSLGSMFVFEPWLAGKEWALMGCKGQPSESDCVSFLGQEKANIAFQRHWDTWITQDDLRRMKSYGLNTIRVPVGYWMKEDLVEEDEHFPQGGEKYLERLCDWASGLGFYIIIDLHGAPGAQVSNNADTGQYVSKPGFYVDAQYERATRYLSFLTTLIHTRSAYRNVGMLEIVNEPLMTAPESLFSKFYPSAYNAIRAVEAALKVSSPLYVQLMNPLWSRSNPLRYLNSTFDLSYDDHRYLKWDTSLPVSQSTYINNSCHSFRGTTDGSGIPTVVGEFSLSVPDNVQSSTAWSISTQQAFYQDWFAAMVTTWEKQTTGWIFWAWRAQLGDWRWSYEDAVAAGIIPISLERLNKTVCVSY